MAPPIPTTPPHACPEPAERVSINRVQIIDLPGLPIDDEVRGQKAYNLFSNLAVIRYAKQKAEALELPRYANPTQARREVPRLVDVALDSPNPIARAAAQSIGRRLGRNLGHILLTLHRGDAINRAARPDWTTADWEGWADIERVWLGGGLMSGKLGRLIVEHARVFLAEVGCADCLAIALTPYRNAMTILGAGRYLPLADGNALCFDFGQTSVKRALLGFEADALTRIEHHPSLPVEWDIHNENFPPTTETGRQVFNFVIETVTQTMLSEIGVQSEALQAPTLDANLMLVIAAYVNGGQLLGNGLYATMSSLSDDLRPLLAEAIQARTGQRVQIHLIHDGTAAAALHAGEPHSAILVIGTAIGVGFPPASEVGLRSLGSQAAQSLL